MHISTFACLAIQKGSKRENVSKPELILVEPVDATIEVVMRNLILALYCIFLKRYCRRADVQR